jgi:hypothetical protein
MDKVLVRKPVFPSDFRALFQTIARCAVAGPFGVAAGCASSITPGELDAASPEPDAAQHASDAAQHEPDAAQHERDAAQHEPDAAQPMLWTQLTCDEDGNWPLQDTTIDPPLDSLALYSTYLDPNTMTRSSFPYVVRGPECAGASDAAGCAAELQQKIDEFACQESSCPDFLMATEGDTVTRIEERSALLALLGTIDTEVEAAIAALLVSGQVYCWREPQPGEEREATGTRVQLGEEGYVVETLASCYEERSTGRAVVDAAGNVTVTSRISFCEGRRPAGLAASVTCIAQNEVGAHFARAAHFEAASVFAFEQLARDLVQLGAPRELVRLALSAALDEVGHARTMHALAERFGGQRVVPEIAAPASRGALAIALENAVEGCVRETYSALLACYQAQAARDPHVRAAMTQIADDETRHAQLSWQIAAWLEPQLSDEERAAVALARRAAYQQLSGELGPRLTPAAMRLVGLPDEATSLALLHQLNVALELSA